MNENQESLELRVDRLKSNVDIPFLLQGGLLLTCFLLLYGRTLPPLYVDWLEFKQFSHGLLVPFIAGYMAWQKRKELQATPVKSSAWGALLIVPALGMALVGKAIGDAFTERVGMVLCLSGLVWLLFGWQIFKRLSFPLGYLWLMIPLPYVIVNEVAFKLRIMDAAVAAPVLRLLGVPVYRDNYFLHLPDVTLEVADLCSGISSVFSLFALGGAYVFFSPMRPTLKLLAVFSTIPFAVSINLLRIILTAALSYYVSLSVLNMLIHELTGTITFFIALALFILLCEMLQRRCLVSAPHSTTPRTWEFSAGGETPSAPPVNVNRSWQPTLLGLALLIPAVYLSANVTAQTEKSLANELANVGTQLAGYQADDSKGTGFYKDPGADVEISRIYSTAQSAPIELYIGFKGKQQADKRLKSPRLGFPYGWNYVWIEPARVASSNANLAINANWMLTQNGQHRVLVLYWFQTGEETVSGEFEKRMNQIRNALLHRRSDGAVVRLATPVTNSDKIDEAKNRLAMFAAELYPRLRGVLPL
ncbi:MAG: exosortase C-terminal domain/associated protein EpsI [Candidatus Binatia bacterium]